MNDPRAIFDAYQADPGQDMYEYGVFLQRVSSGNILEIGVRGGVSTAAFLLSGASHVYSVDIDPRCAELYAGHPKWTFIHSDSRALYKVCANIPGRIDVLFIDGDHSYEGLLSDLRNYVPLVREGGLVIVHDVAPVNSLDLTPEQVANGWAGPYTSKAWNDFLAETRLWRQSRVLPGKFGLGVIEL